jgi:hypothetical protein
MTAARAGADDASLAATPDTTPEDPAGSGQTKPLTAQSRTLDIAPACAEHPVLCASVGGNRLPRGRPYRSVLRVQLGRAGWLIRARPGGRDARQLSSDWCLSSPARLLMVGYVVTVGVIAPAAGHGLMQAAAILHGSGLPPVVGTITIALSHGRPCLDPLCCPSSAAGKHRAVLHGRG